MACWTFLGLMVGVFAAQLALVGRADGLVQAAAFVPGALFDVVEPAPGMPALPPPVTLVSYVFLHAGWGHLLGNLVFLWVFGPRVEAAFGPGPFTAFFIACAVLAALGQASADPASPVSMVGASGAVSGVLGAYLLLRPRAEIRILVPVFVVMRIVSLPAFVVLVAWFLFQLTFDYLTPAGTPGIAFRAHVTGFLAGLLLTPVFQPAWLRARWAPR